MNKVVKRSFSVILSLVMIIGIVFSNGMTLESKAAIINSGSCGVGGSSDVTWTLDDLGTLTISGTGAMNYYYSNTNQPWYSYNTSIKKIVVENGVTSIGEHAFLALGDVTSVTIPPTVTTIGPGAFSGCSSLTSVTIPEGVTIIGGEAFFGCSSLTNVTIPSTVTGIGNSAFEYCNLLSSVTIPASVTNIASHAFENCTSLNTITFLGDCPTIGDNVFDNISPSAKIYAHSDKVEEYRSRLGAQCFPIEETNNNETSNSCDSDSSSSSSTQAHTHNLEWVTTSAPTTEHDGTASLVCSSCGHVADTQTISRTAVVYQDITNKFETELSKADLVNVAAGTTVKIELGDWHSVPSNLMDKILKCKADVELTYRYKGVNYDIVIPAGKGIDLHIRWYGPLLMYSLYGKYSK